MFFPVIAGLKLSNDVQSSCLVVEEPAQVFGVEYSGRVHSDVRGHCRLGARGQALALVAALLLLRVAEAVGTLVEQAWKQRARSNAFTDVRDVHFDKNYHR